MFKINFSTKDGKTYKLEAEAPSLMQKQLGNKINGEDVSTDFAGYELEITGASDKSGFTAMHDVQGFGLKKVLLGYGKGMQKKPKGEHKKSTTPGGLRLRKTVRGNTISEAISQINLKVIKEGAKKLAEIFPEQNKAPAPTGVPSEEGKAPAEEPKAEEKPVEPAQEEKKEVPESKPEKDSEAKPEEKKEEIPTQEKTESSTESPKQEAVDKELSNPEEEPKEVQPEKKEE